MSTLPKLLRGEHTVTNAKRLVVSTGAVTTIAARTATAGHLLAFRNASTTRKLMVYRVGAKFTLTTAYGAAQETGCDLILARSYSASHTGATAVDLGSTVASTNELLVDFPTSAMGTAGLCRVADTGALTAGTQTLDANPIGVLSAWTAAIGDKVPLVTAGGHDDFGDLYNADKSRGLPIVLGANEGLIIRNLILMGATGVGRWDFLIEWAEGVQE